MNRQEYMRELEKALRAAHVADCDDILDEYNEHFELKLRDGYSEEEIATRLGVPRELAGQFEVGGEHKRHKAIITTGLVISDMMAVIFFIFLYAWCVLLGAFTISCAGLGACVVSNVSPYGLIPDMPYICSLLLTPALLAAAVLSAIGTLYCAMYSTQLVRVYTRWHKSVMSGGAHISPPMSKHPVIGAKKRRVMRAVALVALVIFAVFFIVGIVSMMIASRSLEPWHVWSWFAG